VCTAKWLMSVDEHSPPHILGLLLTWHVVDRIHSTLRVGIVLCGLAAALRPVCAHLLRHCRAFLSFETARGWKASDRLGALWCSWVASRRPDGGISRFDN